MLGEEESSDAVEAMRLAHAREVFNQATRIVIFTGAGVSRSPPANIPTYEEAGLTFSRAMVESKDARWLSFQDKVRASQPTVTHRFCESLYYEGRLHRVYTQNVDELHEMCLPPHMVVAVHGHALDPATLVCMEEDPWTRNPDLMSNLLSDFPMDQSQHPDMCLVLGTRLAVNPFRWFPNLINPTWCPPFLRQSRSELSARSTRTHSLWWAL